MSLLFEQMKTVKERVDLLLRKYSHLRDDDFRLVSTYHYNEIGAERVKKMGAMEFLQLYADAKLTHSASIIRMRAIIQKENELLRGEKFSERITHGKEITSKIHELND